MLAQQTELLDDADTGRDEQYAEHAEQTRRRAAQGSAVQFTRIYAADGEKRGEQDKAEDGARNGEGQGSAYGLAGELAGQEEG